MIENKNVKKLAWVAVALVIMVLSMTVVSKAASNPENHKKTIEALDEKKADILKLTATSAAASTAIAAIPGDATTPIANKLTDLTSYFLIILVVIFLEKYLVTLTGYATFSILIPAACVLFAAGIGFNRTVLKIVAAKIAAFGLVIFMIIPFSMNVSAMIEKTYESTVEETVKEAQDITNEIEKNTDSEGKAMDMMQTAQLLGFDTTIVGCTNDYAQTANSDVVVITSGIPRKPGMTREELIGVNAGIVKSVAENLLKYSPNAIIVVISNPMDTMTYLALKSLGLPKNRVIGMGGALDSSRFKYFLSQALGCNANEVEGMVIGGHGDTTMIPLARLATYKGQPVSTLLSEEKLNEVVASTMVGGATLTKLLGTSAWYAPGAAGAYVVESIIHNQKKMVPCSVMLEGEYGESDLCIGVPVILGKNGIEKIVELELNADEKAKFAASAAAVHKTNAALKEVGAL